MTTKAPGNSGKKEALETLHRAGQFLTGIDLSCIAMGGLETVTGGCSGRTLLEDLEMPNARLIEVNLASADLRRADLTSGNLARANLSRVDLRLANLSDAVLVGANLSRARLSNANLSRADLRDVNFSFADLWQAALWHANLRTAQFSNASLRNTNLSGANLEFARFPDSDLWDTDLRNANISDANFCTGLRSGPDARCAENLTQAQIDTAWAWADRPPIFKSVDDSLPLESPPLCDPALRQAYGVVKRFGRPEGC